MATFTTAKSIIAFMDLHSVLMKKEEMSDIIDSTVLRVTFQAHIELLHVLGVDDKFGILSDLYWKGLRYHFTVNTND